MPARGLKNFRRESFVRNGIDTWRLVTPAGDEIEAFTRFAEFAERYSPRTSKRYMEVVGHFLDYLYEAGVFKQPAPTSSRLNAVIDAYPLLLRDGSDLVVKRVLEKSLPNSADAWLAETASALEWAPIQANSFSNTTAAINHFLSLSESLAREELERANLLGIKHTGGAESLIKALQGTLPVSSREVHRMRQNSMLGSVAKYMAKGMRRPRRIRSSAHDPQLDTENKDFPLRYLPALIEAATSWRDRALWLLLAASGIRSSEARNLLLEDVLADEQRVYVLDPTNRRFRPPDSVRHSPRFKGRAIAATYLFPPFRQDFFHALEQYLKHEYVPAVRPGQARYLFQYVEPNRRGEPYVYASDAAVLKAFKAAARKAGVPLPFDGKEYGPHSLRHAYGVYMLNDYPVDPEHGRLGLPITDVQMLMGHKSLATTQKYARVKSERLMQKLKASDEQMLHLSSEERLLLPSTVLDHLGVTLDKSH